MGKHLTIKTVLETLISFWILIEFLSSSQHEISSHEDKLYLDLVQSLLEHMKTFQTFLTTNCSAITSVLENSGVFDSWIKPNILKNYNNNFEDSKIKLIV